MSGRADQPDRPQNEQRTRRGRERHERRGRQAERQGRRLSGRSRRPVGSRRLGNAGRSLLSVSGIALLTATKAADAATTAVGLVYVPGVYEANTVAALLLHRMGVVTGLLVTSVAVIVVIALVTEVASITVCARRADAHLASVVRLVGYGVPSTLFAAVSMYNVSKLLAGIEAAQLF